MSKLNFFQPCSLIWRNY